MTHRIVICDDEAFILRAAEFKLKRAGYEVRCANDGQEAWEMILEDAPDLLVADCQMPYMDGLTLAKNIHENPQTNQVPVIMLTAKGFELSHRELHEKYGVLAVVPKPFSPRLLLQRIKLALER